MNKVEIVCTVCGNRFLRLTKQVNQDVKRGSKKVTCSKICQAASQRKGKIFICAVCGKNIYRPPNKTQRSKSGQQFCSKSCSNGSNNTLRSGSNHPNYINGVGGYRELALQVYGRKCTVIGCGYGIVQILEVHHRNKDRSNNSKENLDVLCPTHHSEFDWEIRKYTDGNNSEIA